MGLFSSVIRAVSPIGNLILGSSASKKAVGKARDATLAGLTNAKGDLNSQLAASQGRLDPYEHAGTDALSGIRGLLGLDGGDAQGGAIAGLQDSPLFKSLMRGGQDILLNNASATGGLRGGNFENGLANFSADTLSQVIQQQLSNLGGLSSQGLNATQFGANLGAQNAGLLGQLDTGAGQANAGAILNKNAITNNMFSQLNQMAMGAASGGASGGIGGLLSSVIPGLGSLFGGGGGGGGGSIFSGSGSGYGSSGGALPNFPKINIALPSAGAGLPGF